MTVDTGSFNRLRATGTALRDFAADGLALFGSTILVLLYILPVVLHPTIFVPIPNVLIVGMGVTVASLPFAGAAVLRRTPFDLLFSIWAILVVLSHIYAIVALDRQLQESSMIVYITFVLAMWVAFRAGYAMVTASPTFGPMALMIALVLVLFASAVLGIFQAIGPVKQQAVEFGARFTGSLNNVLEGSAIGRPTGVFGGPNILGYANIVGGVCLVGIGVVYAKVLRPWHVLLIMATLGVFGLSTLLAQSRTSLAVFCLVVFGFGIALRRLGAHRASMATYVALCLAVGSVGMVVMQESKLDYVGDTLTNDISKDSSVLYRQQTLKMAANIASDIAPLGTGVGQANQEQMVRLPGYDRYWTMAVDSEWINAYLAHGVWGPLFIGMFFVYGFRGAARARRSLRPVARMLGSVATTALLVNLIVGFGGVRIGKYETGIFIALLLGAAFAASDEDLRRGTSALPRPTPVPPVA